MPNRTIPLSLFVLVLAAEMLASLWRLLRLPTDTYIGVADYELGRMLYWLPLVGLAIVFVSTFESKFQALKAREYTRQRLLRFAAMAALAFCVEALTSFGYWWHSPHSHRVRALYESVWYWHRVPRQSDYGWPSFAGYFMDHLMPWTAVILLGLGAWYLKTRKAPPVR
jgi:hypothetical protein